MSWKPIVVGVDRSPEAAEAAAFAWEVAQRARTSCHLVHATRDAWQADTAAALPARLSELTQAQLLVAREQVARSLELVLPPHMVEQLTVHRGRAALVLSDMVAELDAGLVVLGGKHHSTLGRWLGGSTSHDAVRLTNVPVLVVAGKPRPIKRVLVAVDLSPASRPTLELAAQYATLFGARLRALCVFEPLPAPPESPEVDSTAFYELCQQTLDRDVWPALQFPGAERMVRHGNAVEALLRETNEWRADLLVVGSHGKNLAQRVLLGSVTERLLSHLPTSLLVAHAAEPVRPRRRRRDVAAAAV